MTPERPGASAAGVLPADLTVADVTWDDPDGARLRHAQQAEIAVRYGGHDDVQPADGWELRPDDDAPTAGGAPTAGAAPVGPTDPVAHGVDPATVVAAVTVSVDGVAVGFGALRDISGDEDPSGIVHADGTLELKRLYIAPAHRGRGLSRIVLRALEARATARGARRVVLETGTQQPESIGLYLGEGYLPIEQYGEYWGEPDSRCFGKDLPVPVVVTPAAWNDPEGRALRVRFQSDEVAPLYPQLAEAVTAAGGFDTVDVALGERVVAGALARRAGDVVGCGFLATVASPDAARHGTAPLGAEIDDAALHPAGPDANGRDIIVPDVLVPDAATTEPGPGTLEIVKVYVTPEARRWGVARAVVNDLVSVARGLGAHRLVLVTGVRQPAAVTLYRSMGFRPVYPFGEYSGSSTALFFELEL
ncbi:GNAT family N-acetyltransferase [Sanguibacter sp. A247]|uniref:GNAT family N-acetyltransferase n=1 Tax=unclassified Sanguibacter TaxID=2645534 RepID=UPI003FD76B73